MNGRFYQGVRVHYFFLYPDFSRRILQRGSYTRAASSTSPDMATIAIQVAGAFHSDLSTMPIQIGRKQFYSFRSNYIYLFYTTCIYFVFFGYTVN